MEIQIECDCGEVLSIISTSPDSNNIWLTVEKCEACGKDNYEAGEADAKQERL